MKNVKQFLTAFIFIFNGIFCFGETILVPQDSASIQSAIDAANIGDTVLVDTGTYVENINFSGKNIVVASKFILDQDPMYILKTIIDGSGAPSGVNGSCVRFISGEDSAATIEGFTLTGGSGTLINSQWIEGGGVIILNSSPTVKNNLIVDNNVSAGGGGISSFYNSEPHIYNNILANNEADYAGGIVFNWCGGIMRNNIIYGNTATGRFGSGGVMIWANNNAAYIENNSIIGNTSYSIVGGLSTNVSGTSYIRNNIIRYNTQGNEEEIAILPSTQFEYNNTSSSISGTGNIESNPDFSEILFSLNPSSACIDAGDPNTIYNDVEDGGSPGNALLPSQGTVRNDMGAYGGPYISVFPEFINEKLKTNSAIVFWMNVGDTVTQNLVINNLSTHTMRIDSIVMPSGINGVQYNDKMDSLVLKSLNLDTIPLTIIAQDTVSINNSILIYHNGTKIPSPQSIPFLLDTKHSSEELEEGLRAYWKFNETSGSIVTDEKGISHGTLISSPDHIMGVEGNAIGFPISDAYSIINIPATDSIEFGADVSFTVSAMVKNDPMNFTNEVYILLKGTTTGIGKWYALSFKSGMVRFTVDDNIVKTSLDYTLPETYNAGLWHYITGVRDRENNKLFLYLDGEEVANRTDNTTETLESGLPLVLSNYSSTMNTALDEVKIYNKVLSPLYIKAQYESYDFPEPSSDATMDTLAVLYYPFNEGAFDVAQHNYTVDLPAGTPSAIVIAEGSDYFARFTGLGSYSNWAEPDTITITSEDGSASNQYVITFNVPLSVENFFRSANIKVFPNPASNVLTIERDEENKISQIQLTNIVGEVFFNDVFNGKRYTLNMSGYMSGLYILKIDNVSQLIQIK